MKPYLFVAISSLFILVGCTTSTNTTNVGDDSKGSSNSTIYPAEMFDLNVEYKGESSWHFTAEADMPTPCHSLAVGDVMVAESYPEQVTIELKVKEPGDNIMCTQVIDPQKVSGEFNASELATYTYRVVVEE